MTYQFLDGVRTVHWHIYLNNISKNNIAYQCSFVEGENYRTLEKFKESWA